MIMSYPLELFEGTEKVKYINVGIIDMVMSICPENGNTHPK